MCLKSSSKRHAFWNGRLIIFTPVFASLNQGHEGLAGNKTKSSPPGPPFPLQ